MPNPIHTLHPPYAYSTPFLYILYTLPIHTLHPPYTYFTPFLYPSYTISNPSTKYRLYSYTRKLTLYIFFYSSITLFQQLPSNNTLPTTLFQQLPSNNTLPTTLFQQLPFNNTFPTTSL